MLTNFVITNVSARDYYKSRIEEWDGVNSSNVSCPFAESKHEKGTDRSKGFSVNIKNAGGCYCHACKTKIGSIVHFEKELYGYKTDEEAALAIYKEFVHPIIEIEGYKNETVVKGIETLENSERIYELLQEELGFTQECIEKFQLGWDKSKQRLIIPIFNQWDHLINIRYYKPPSMRGPDTKYKIYNEKGFGKPSLFPLNLLEQIPNHSKTLYWMKAERDVILAWSLGIPAFCSTGGETSDHTPFLKYLKKLGYFIIVCGDNDKVGKQEVERKVTDLQNYKIPCGWVEIPEGQKDFADWILNEGKTADDFRQLKINTNDTPPIEVEPDVVVALIPGMVDATERILEGEYEVSDIGRRPEILNQAIEVQAVISARLDRTYSIPYIFEIDGDVFRLPISRELLNLVASEDRTILKFITNLLKDRGIKIKSIRPVDYITVTEVEIIPVLVPGQDAMYVNQRCFFFGDKFEANIPYRLHVIPTSMMRTQETVGLIFKASPISNVLDNYVLTEEDACLLEQKFSLPPEATGEDSYLKMVDLANEIADKHTMIYNRTDLHILQLLTWCSPIQFNFHCEGLQRGWLNALVVGDSQTGKSQIAIGLRDLFACGTFLNSENCTFVGLIGGAIKCASGMFMLRWGKIPLYNRQLVVLEELSGLTCEEISNMSDVRSSGVARLDKGGISGETSAKTRLLCLSNVRRKHANLGDYHSGVKAIQELIGQNEDISRFDLILTVTDNEVSNDIINRDRIIQYNVPYSAEEKELFRKLIMFIWSLKPEQIELTDGAYRACLETTKKLAKIYHSSIPIFKAGSGRLKLARIACAIAALQFSWNRIKGKLIVTEKHVRAVEMLLKQYYNKPSLGYGKYSKQMFYLENISEEEKLEKVIKRVFADNGGDLDKEKQNRFFRYLSMNGAFEKEELMQSTGLSEMNVERLISAMLNSNVIRRSQLSTRLVWETTMPGRRWLERHYSI